MSNIFLPQTNIVRWMDIKDFPNEVWIDVCRKRRITMDVFVEYGTGKEWQYNEIALENEDKIGSYWFNKRNEFAGLAMQAIISNQELLEECTNFIETDGKRGFYDYGGMKNGNDKVAKLAVAYADTLVEELKK